MAEIRPPREVFDLQGHEATEEAFEASRARGRLHHAWLLTGAEGVGKATFAYRAARRLLGAPAEPAYGVLGASPDHPVSRQVIAHSHPDLFVLERADETGKLRKVIPVDEARGLSEFFSKSPASAPHRVAIIDAIDDLNVNAANAILKTLEEPPAHGVLLMVSHAPGRLLPTIRSRCRRLPLRPLSEALVAELLGRYRPDLSASDRSALLELAEGSIGHAIELAEQGGLALHRRLVELLGRLPELDVSAVYTFADGVSRWGNDDAFRVFTELMPATIARAIAKAAQSGGTDAESSLGRLLAKRGLERWVEVWEAITALFAEAEAVNLDRKQVVLNAFLALQSAASG